MMSIVRSAWLAATLLTPLVAGSQESLAVVALRDWYAGVSLDGQTEKGATFRAFHSADGKISAVVDGQHRNTGTWKIVEPGHVCVAWKDTAWGNNPCYTVLKDGEQWKVVRVDDAKLYTRVKRIEGNAFSF